MTTVCLVGDAETDLRYELLSRETARDALATYDLRSPFENSVALDTVSLGAAVSLCNDLNWYLVRFVEETLIREPSISTDEWLSRDLATAVRTDKIRREETDRFLKLYGVDDGRLVEPMYLARSDGADLPTYDLRDVDETVRVRVTRGEFER
ncbi:DUF5804 family protein [Halobaculum sp. CBA1158]|uniref:DUF5804 family protein n=1 Tax=Halobaculum sp. CBA1158 TaxID=2904243 RepID=UPI001F225020|nr:DUF5804 family protein [Halobaculum sp. CBA1158]UIO98853.1 DUF5804 family protein [Halobaculum sp. CBA1158]